MLRSLAVLALGWLALAPPAAAQGTAQAPPAPPPPAFKVGDKVPDVTLPYLAAKAEGGFETRQVALSQYLGKQNVVLAFFPAAFSPGCTTEMQRYREKSGEFNATNTVVFGVSVDSTWANKAFKEQLGLDFPILSDWKKTVSRQFGVLNEDSGFANRVTFVIDTTGVVRHIDIGRDALDPSAVVGACKLLKKT